MKVNNCTFESPVKIMLCGGRRQFDAHQPQQDFRGMTLNENFKKSINPQKFYDLRSDSRGSPLLFSIYLPQCIRMIFKMAAVFAATTILKSV